MPCKADPDGVAKKKKKKKKKNKLRHYTETATIVKNKN